VDETAQQMFVMFKWLTVKWLMVMVNMNCLHLTTTTSLETRNLLSYCHKADTKLD